MLRVGDDVMFEGCEYRVADIQLGLVRLEGVTGWFDPSMMSAAVTRDALKRQLDISESVRHNLEQEIDNMSLQLAAVTRERDEAKTCLEKFMGLIETDGKYGLLCDGTYPYSTVTEAMQAAHDMNCEQLGRLQLNESNYLQRAIKAELELGEAQKRYETQCQGSMSDKQRIAHLEATCQNYAVKLHEAERERDELRKQLSSADARIIVLEKNETLCQKYLDESGVPKQACEGGDFLGVSSRIRRLGNEANDLRDKLATAEADLQAIAKVVEPNYSNDMRLVDEIVIAIGNLQEAVKCSDEACAKAEADAAAMRRTMIENESRLKDVIRRIGVSATTGWITHELNHVLLDIPSGTAGRELLEQLRRKDERIRELERHATECEAGVTELQAAPPKEQSPVWRYRKAGFALYRTKDEIAIQYCHLGSWEKATMYRNWQELCDDSDSYPCDKNGKRI